MKDDSVPPTDQGPFSPQVYTSAITRFIEIYEEHNPKPFRNFEYQMGRMFRGIDLSGKNILEVGCGVGYISLFLAITNPDSTIYAMDESEGNGAGTDVIDILKGYVAELGLKNIEVIKAEFNEWESDRTFDIVTAKNAIHHFPWSESVTKESNAFIFKNDTIHDAYIEIFRKLTTLISPEGHLVFGDVSRANVYRLMPIGIRKKFRTVNWRTKPSKKEWLYLLEKTGYLDIEWICDVPYKLRSLAKIWRYTPAPFFFPDFYFHGKR